MSREVQSIAHALPWYAPESWGGTEQYVAALMREQVKMGLSPIVLAPSAVRRMQRYEHDGIAVLRWVPGLRPTDQGSFLDCLRTSGAHLLHLHGWTPECGSRELHQAHGAGTATVVTVHTSAMICATGTMVFCGGYACDQVASSSRCATCWLHARGVPGPIAAMAAAIPESWSRALLERANGRWRRLPGARAQMVERYRQFRSGVQGADRVVAVCGWLHRAILELGADARRTVVCDQGVEVEWLDQRAATLPRTRSERLEVAFVGRWDRCKGLDKLVAALRAMPDDCPFQLRIAMTEASDDESRRYRAELMPQLSDDARIELNTAPARATVRDLMASSHVVAIPSQWLETGPLVAIEARALGTFVLASDLGGMSERLRNDAGAMLVSFNDVSAWTRALVDLHRRRDELVTGVWPARVRSSRDVADEMCMIYEQAMTSARERAAL